MHNVRYLILLSALTFLSGCSLIQGGKLYSPELFGLTRIAADVYIEQDADDVRKVALTDAVIKARNAIKLAYGDIHAHPKISACITEECFWKFGGRGEFAKVYGTLVLLSPRALNWHFIAHEWSHAEMITRLNLSAWKRMPQWFDEGLAVAISEAPEHSEDHWQYLVMTDTPRPMPEELHTLKSLDQWLSAVQRYSDNKNAERKAHGEPEIHSVYAASGHEIRPWLATAGTPGLLAFIEKLNHGETFESAYEAADSTVHVAPRQLAQHPKVGP